MYFHLLPMAVRAQNFVGFLSCLLILLIHFVKGKFKHTPFNIQLRMPQLSGQKKTFIILIIMTNAIASSSAFKITVPQKNKFVQQNWTLISIQQLVVAYL